MDILALLNGLKETIEALQAKLVDAQASVDEAVKASYDKGFADGVASVPVSDKMYSQAEVDAKLAEVVEPLNAKIAELEQKVIDLGAGQEKAIADAVAAFKADLAEKYAALQVVEQQAETGFAELLK